MLYIKECKTCNADKNTCPIRNELSGALKSIGIRQRLVYKCREWQKHLKYKVGDKIVFYFIERGFRGGEWSGETLEGVIYDISKKRPVYMVRIDTANRNLIDKEYSNYDKYVNEEEEWDGEGSIKTGFFTVPVKEELIVGISE